ncbi:FAD/NAD(P)-binding protein [Trueperella pecoris]|uniref:FAD/NAD(P)-binding protein n=1 Tax=Trueperella pecoris TaxID=2733571 RepID=A0A7M1QTL4_9ACTO|nr:FAD/NAD(P)-binding domain-containing protein [Trueperella pecoris]QOR45248.1 FAD/NAD(P)-binding protein [Trueperella pecoris]QTG75152.1 FAD/NAD(P)-binding protein [Trueperella pecoris]
MEIAIIGAGPRGLSALHAVAAEVTAPLRVHLFGALDDAGARVIGQGTPFYPDQPGFSRLNAHSKIVDTFAVDRQQAADGFTGERAQHGHRAPHPIVGMSFDEWSDEPGEDFPPRRKVGRYFSYAADVVINALPANIDLVEHRKALAVGGEPGAWAVTCPDGVVNVPELLLTMGHADHARTPLTAQDITHIADCLVTDPYPVSNLDDIAPGSRVATRGAGLTFVDVALALTEGRGGQFSADGRRYTPSGREPEILATNRDGAFPDAKPPLDVVLNDIPARRWEAARAAIMRSLDLGELMDALRELTVDVLRARGFSDPDQAYDAVMAGPQPGPGRARERLAEAVDAARGEGEIPARIVMSETWQEVMAEIGRRVEGEIFPAKQWKEFKRAYGLVKKSSYGPPLINSQKILTLVETGLIDTRHLDAGIDALELPERVDVFVDCVLPPAGFWPGAYPALAQIEDYLSVWSGKNVDRVGVRVDAAGSVLDAQEVPIPGLAAIGRMTEDWVIDNDNLDALAHPHMRLWARRIARLAQDR